ncbi:MAG: ATP-binding protein [Longimicrobiales bacterium]
MTLERTSIRTLLLALTVSVALPLLALWGFAQVGEVRAERSRAHAALMGQADVAALAIAQFLEDSERILVGLSRDPRIRSLDPAACGRPHLPEYQNLLTPTYSNVFTWRIGEGIVCSALGAPDPAPGDQNPPWVEGAEGEEGFRVGPVQEEDRAGRRVTVLSYPVIGFQGQREGLVLLSVDLVTIETILEKMGPGKEGVIMVTEGGGRVVARSRDPGQDPGATPPTPGAGSEDGPPFAQRGTIRAGTLEGGDALFGFTRIPGTDWFAWAGMPRRTAYGPLWERWFLSGLLALAALGVAVGMGRWILGRITAPLAILASETAAARGEESAPLSIQGPREVARVAERFNEAWESRAQAEEELRRSIERIRSLVENAVTGIYVSTEGGRFLEVNQAMVDLLGYDSREELLSTPVSALYDSVRQRLEYLADHGRKDFFRGVEVLWKRKDGTPITVRLFGRRFENADGEASWEVIVEDVTALRNLQEQYLQAQKMEALGRLAGGVAHDFNNLLTVVQGQADLILEDPRVGEDLRAEIREISDAAIRGAELNRQLLAFGRRAGERREALDLNKVLRGFELMIRRISGEEISTELALSPELGWILGDRGQLEQVVMNLVVNARDAMPRGGSLQIETYNTELSDEEAAAYPPATPGPHVVLAVSDTGTGIGANVLPNIFEPFFSTKPETKGSGLGLSTVYGIVTALGGHARVESALGRGTTFRLFFPRRDARPATETPLPEGSAPRTGSGLILLAEDEGPVRRLTTRILERAGYEVLSAADGKEALRLARGLTTPLDLLLSDVVMPEIRGPELAGILAREGRVRRAVLFSGYPEGLREAGLRGLETWELIPKPFTSGELLAAVARALEGQEGPR